MSKTIYAADQYYHIFRRVMQSFAIFYTKVTNKSQTNFSSFRPNSPLIATNACNPD